MQAGRSQNPPPELGHNGSTVSREDESRATGATGASITSAQTRFSFLVGRCPNI